MELSDLSVIIAIAAILSPIIVEAIKSNYNLKIKLYEEKEKAKNEIIVNFIERASERTYVDYESEKYYNALSKLLLYIPYSKVKAYSNDPSVDNLNKLIDYLSGQITYRKLQ